MPAYLAVLSSWLQGSESYYTSRGVPVPWNGWEVIQTALRAAIHHE